MLLMMTQYSCESFNFMMWLMLVWFFCNLHMCMISVACWNAIFPQKKQSQSLPFNSFTLFKWLHLKLNSKQFSWPMRRIAASILSSHYSFHYNIRFLYKNFNDLNWYTCILLFKKINQKVKFFSVDSLLPIRQQHQWSRECRVWHQNVELCNLNDLLLHLQQIGKWFTYTEILL